MEEYYFDNSATTSLGLPAQKAMLDAMENWGNPSSLHARGRKAEQLLMRAREQLLMALGAATDAPNNLIFTASGTEADNLALFGTAHAKSANAGKKIIISDSEHTAILRSAEQLETQGYQVARIGTVGGVFDMEQFRTQMTPDTILVSVMTVNNETGALSPLHQIGNYARSVNPQVVFHTDAVQGFLKVPLSPAKTGADLITVSAHKIHGPKGVGALYVAPHILKEKKLSPVIFGGGQEWSFRSGTENVIGIAGFGAAAEAGHKNLSVDVAKMRDLREYLISQITTRVDLCEIVCNLPSSQPCAPHILNIRLPKIKSNTMLNFLSAKQIYVSSGSACSASSDKVSHTLLAFGLTEEEADTSIRISLCPQNTRAQADILLSALAEGLQSLIRFH